MKNSLKTTKITFIVLMIIGLLVIGLAIYMALGGKNLSSGKKPTPSPSPSPSPTLGAIRTEGDTKCDVLVLSVDTAAKTIRVYEPENDIYLTLSYTGTTDIKNRFGEVISASLLKPYTIAEASYDIADNRLYRLYQCEDFWKYEEPASWSLSFDKKMMTINDANYRVSANVAAFAADGEYQASLLSNMDIINVYGKGQRVFAIELVHGHGTIFVMNEAPFLGGSLFVDNVYAGQITEGFALGIREGSYEISFSLGDLNGKQEVTVDRNGTAIIDMKQYAATETTYGMVTFWLTPENAQLFVDNFYYPSNEPIKLSYGTHFVEVSAEGYTSWGGMITVSTEEMSLTIGLVEQFFPTSTPSPTPSPEVTEEPEPTETPGPTSAAGSPTPTPETTAGPTPGTDEKPSPTPELPGDSTSENSTKVTISWFPSSVITVDSVYVGTTDASGLLEVELSYGNHVIGLTRTSLDGSTRPKTYQITVDANTSKLLSFPTGS